MQETWVPSNAGGTGSIPDQGAWPKKQNIEQRQYCNKFNEDFLNGLHQKESLKRSHQAFTYLGRSLPASLCLASSYCSGLSLELSWSVLSYVGDDGIWRG